MKEIKRYNEDWKFKKFSDLLISDKEKEIIYKLYININDESRKRLFLYLNYELSNKAITKLINTETGVLTLNGITSYLTDKLNLFQEKLKFLCNNPSCDYSEKVLETTKSYFKCCPKCKSQVEFINRDDIYNTFFALYLNYFEFYLLNEVDKTIYIIRNKYNGKHYSKVGDESFANWIYIKLLENECDVNKFILAETNGKPATIKNSLINLIKNNNLINTIDNINFKPILENNYLDEGRTFFNLYRGNKYLNLNINEDEENNYLNKCPNILELLFNLCGKDKKGVDFLINVLSMMLQSPEIKTKQLIIFYGEEAAGKGTFHDLILKPLFQGYIIKILGKKLKSEFNQKLSEKLVLVLEEVKADKGEEDTIKELVTEDTILINPKGLPERDENNYLTIFGFSNEQNPISAGKRRGVYYRSRTLGGDKTKAPDFRDKYEKEIPLELDYFVKELKTRKYDRIKIMKGYETEAKQQVINQNLSVIERFFLELCNYDGVGKYVSELIASGELNLKRDILLYLHKYEGINYVQADFLLILYNEYLKENKYKSISLNKFAEFWQLSKINRDNKKHWKRLINPTNDKKTQYVNLDILNREILKRYEND